MRIAILGWGSLIWNPETLPHDGRWRRGGPGLPIEFCRISGDGRLTLIVDESHGVEVITRWSISTRADVRSAVGDLAQRERCGVDGIGFLDRATGRDSRERYPSQPGVASSVEAWCADHAVDAAIWTALPFTFARCAGRPFSVANALDYLESLSGAIRARSLDYVRRAPREVDTPVRRAFDADARFSRE